MTQFEGKAPGTPAPVASGQAVAPPARSQPTAARHGSRAWRVSSRRGRRPDGPVLLASQATVALIPRCLKRPRTGHPRARALRRSMVAQ